MASGKPDRIVERPRTGAAPIAAKRSAWAYLGWLFAVALNGFLAFVWSAFGGAAAGNSNSSARGFMLATTLAFAIPLVLSIFFLLRGSFNKAMVVLFATLPMLFVSLYVLGWWMRRA